MSKKNTLKQFADAERAKQVGRNDFTANNEYGTKDTYYLNGGLPQDNDERIKQMNRSDYSANDEYGYGNVED